MKNQLPVPLEKVEQAHGVALLRTIGATVHELGTRRPAKCRRCGQAAYSGTQQTPGLPDVHAFLPAVPKSAELWWEVKRQRGASVSDEQAEFRELCIEAGIWHVTGPLDALIAFLLEHEYLKAAQVPHYRLPKEATS